MAALAELKGPPALELGSNIRRGGCFLARDLVADQVAGLRRWRMIERRARAAGITEYLTNGGTTERASPPEDPADKRRLS